MEVPVQDQTAAFGNLAGQNLRQVIAGPNSAAIILPPRPVRPEDWVSAIPVSGRKLLESKGVEGNVELEPGDTVVVPRLGNTVMVLGAVPRSGAVPFVAGQTLTYYVDESGGLREDAASDRMVVIHANGSAEPVKMKAQLEPGDVLVIPTKHIVRLVRTESAWQQWLRTLMSFGLGALAF
jgi:protein involved in polysaccharide export with SLBB domain